MTPATSVGRCQLSLLIMFEPMLVTHVSFNSAHDVSPFSPFLDVNAEWHMPAPLTAVEQTVFSSVQCELQHTLMIWNEPVFALPQSVCHLMLVAVRRPVLVPKHLLHYTSIPSSLTFGAPRCVVWLYMPYKHEQFCSVHRGNCNV